ncbi:MAG TPA: hypothetical protein VJU87_05075, partial [Gemmatimonadaceae bacterium]|nr:hypothetical protein [Gemmatimonadaceae bacterium]
FRRPPPAHVVGLAFLLLTIGGFVALAAALPRYTLSATARRGLTYDTLFTELHDALVDAPDRPLRRAIRAVQVDAVLQSPNGPVGVTFDTLALAPDEDAYPSLLPGGFLRDEMDEYNATQRERLDAIRRGRLESDGGVDLRAAENPSIFRTELRDADGDRDSVVLAERAVPYGLRVPSPFDAARLVAVTTREWSRTLAWISPRGTRAVEGRGRVPGVPPCPFRSVRDSVYVECTAPGSPFAQLVLRFPDRLGETGTATVFAGLPPLYDGVRLARRHPTPIATGGILQLRAPAAAPPRRTRPEPVVLEWALGGTLGGTQWINGRIRWEPSVSRTSPLVRQLASASGFGASVELEGGRNIPLSIDGGLTDELQEALDDFSACALRSARCDAQHGAAGGGARAATSRSDIAFATVVLASLQTGEILAVAEYGPPTSTGESWILRAVNVGSAIKPLLATAALSRRPELATLEVRNDGPMMHDIWGVPLDREFEAGSDCPFGWINLRTFLGCSSNRFSAALVTAALRPDSIHGLTRWDAAPGLTFRLDGQTFTGRRPHLPLDVRGHVRADVLNESSLAAGLFALDSLTTSIELAAELGRDGRDSSVWSGLHDDRLHPVRAPLGLWPEQSRIGLTPGGRPATMRQVAMFAIGAAENRVTTLDLTEAFARIMTDRRVSLSFVPARGDRSFAPLGIARHAWYPTLAAGLHDVGTTGTAHGTQAAVTQAFEPGMLFYGKTGTLNAPPHVRWILRVDTSSVNGVRVVHTTTVADTVVPPVVAKTLLFAVGRGSAGMEPGAHVDATGAGALRCGVAGTIYFRLRRNPPRVQSLATEFANERLWQVLARHWARIKVC